MLTNQILLRKLLLPLVLATVFGQILTAQTSDHVETTVWHVGDTWLYKHYETDPKKAFRLSQDTVKSVTDKIIKIESKRIDKKESPGEMEWRIGEDPLQFPVFPGKKWTTDIYQKDKIVGNGTKVAIKWERISTAAGDFDALKLESKYTIPGGTYTQHLWYAPAAKNFVKISYIDDKGESFQTMELVSFTINQP